VFTPKATVDFERTIALLARRHAPVKPLTGSLSVHLQIYLVRPKSVRKSRLYPNVRPDLDNYVKAILDGLKGFWLDDGQVVSLNAHKGYLPADTFRHGQILVKIEQLCDD
jgi:Holliday junction resolvase RusA-like endonuclease